jgi:hypothetical protein
VNDPAFREHLLEIPAQFVDGQAQIDERAENHIAAGAGIGVEQSYGHRSIHFARVRIIESIVTYSSSI